MTADRGGTAASISRRIHAFRPYNRMQMQLGSEAQIPDGLLAAHALLGQNSHQGVPTSTHALYQGFGFVISNTALGMRGSLYDEGVGSRYTGKERDAETGLDYMDARYYGSSMGRFMSPDPIFASPERVMDPQQWNMYAYARNNPLSHSDPTGLDFNLKCSGGDSMTCQGGVQGQTLLADGGGTRFEATVVSGSADSGYKDQFGGSYSGTFNETSGVSFTNSATGEVSNHSQFIEGSNATSVNGSGAFSGITANFFNACGGSCQARGTLTGTADAFTSMKSQLVQSSGFKSFLDGLSMAHPLISQQWKDANGYAHLIKAPGDIMDMHFEGASTGAGLQAFILHTVSTIKDIGSGNAFHQRGLMTPGKDPDEQ